LVYPNPEHYAFGIPASFQITKWLMDQEHVTSETIVNTEALDYFGFFWTGGRKFQVLVWLIWLIWISLWLLNRNVGFWANAVLDIKVI
jgi:hypothetical protein